METLPPGLVHRQPNVPSNHARTFPQSVSEPEAYHVCQVFMMQYSLITSYYSNPTQDPVVSAPITTVMVERCLFKLAGAT